MNMRKKICAAMPFIVIIVMVLLLTYAYNPYWWFLLLIIPLTPIILGEIKIKFSFDGICVLTFLISGIFLPTHPWHPAWLVLLLIPIYHIFKD